LLRQEGILINPYGEIGFRPEQCRDQKLGTKARTSTTHTGLLRHASRSQGRQPRDAAVDFPAIKLSSGSPSVGGKNQDVMIWAGFTAIRHAPLGYSVSVGRFWYLPTS
jgi:hypothetical protein